MEVVAANQARHRTRPRAFRSMSVEIREFCLRFTCAVGRVGALHRSAGIMGACLRLICLLVLGTVGCATKSDSFHRTAIFPTARGPELIREVCNKPPEDLNGYWTPRSRDLQAVETALMSYFQSKGSHGKWDWSRFRRQVVGVKRGDDALIFINYFLFWRGDDDSWRTRPYVVEDGGAYFFRVLYDVRNRRIVWYERNGVA